MKTLVDKVIKLLVKPHSKKIYLNQLNDDTFEIAISSKPEKGKANREIIEELSKFFHVRKSQVEILKGHQSRRKIIQIRGE